MLYPVAAALPSGLNCKKLQNFYGTIKITGFVRDKKLEFFCHCRDCNGSWGMISRRKIKNNIVYNNSTSLASLITACQKAFGNSGLGTVLWQRRSSWFASMNQRSPSWMWDSGSPAEKKNIDKMQIPDTMSLKFPRLMFFYLFIFIFSLL